MSQDSKIVVGILAPIQEPFQYLNLVLNSLGVDVEFYDDISEVASQLTYGLLDCVFLDLGLSAIQNKDYVLQLKRSNPYAPILGLCQSESDRLLKLNIFLLEKRLVSERFQGTWKKIAKKLEGNKLLDKRLKRIIGDSYVMGQLRERIKQVAPLNSPVLIEGDSGTGKELVARALSSYSESFIPVNCSAIPEPLFESELFGHQKGSFTGALANRKGLLQEADGGTLFLDEVAELPISVQAKLLRALQEAEIKPIGSDRSIKVRVRVVAATHRNLEEEVRAGRFREDLYYRLSVVPIKVPNLSDRRDDLLLLVSHFVNKYSGPGYTPDQLSEASKTWLESHEFLGNIRELENHVQRALSFLTEFEEELDLVENSGNDISPLDDWSFADFNSWSEQKEKEFIRHHLLRHKGSVSRTAETLGVQRTALQNKMRKFGISSKDIKKELNK